MCFVYLIIYWYKEDVKRKISQNIPSKYGKTALREGERFEDQRKNFRSISCLAGRTMASTISRMPSSTKKISG